MSTLDRHTRLLLLLIPSNGILFRLSEFNIRKSLGIIAVDFSWRRCLSCRLCQSTEESSKYQHQLHPFSIGPPTDWWRKRRRTPFTPVFRRQ